MEDSPIRPACLDTPPAAPTSFDPSSLDELLRLDKDSPGFFDRLIGRFLESTPALIDSVSSATVDSREDAERNAHSLKSSSALFGGHMLAALAAQAEAGLRAGQIDAARELAKAMQAEFARVAELVRGYRARSPDT